MACGRAPAVGAVRDEASVGSGGVWVGAVVEDGAAQAVNPTIIAAAAQRAPREMDLLFMRFRYDKRLKSNDSASRADTYLNECKWHSGNEVLAKEVSPRCPRRCFVEIREKGQGMVSPGPLFEY